MLKFRVNDTEEIESGRKRLIVCSWFFIVVFPLMLMLAAVYLEFDSPVPFLLMAGVYVFLLRLVNPALTENHMNHGKSD